MKQDDPDKERDPLNLRDLPLVSPPAGDWPVIEAALRQHQQLRRRWRLAGGALATAASVTLALGLFLNHSTSIPAGATTGEKPRLSTSEPVPTELVNLASLIALSQDLESKLRFIRADVGVLPTELLIYQVELEDLIVQVDDALSQSPDSLELWSQRVNLMLDLGQIYRNQVRREYDQMASL
jgi:hypothetical protein